VTASRTAAKNAAATVRASEPYCAVRSDEKRQKAAARTVAARIKGIAAAASEAATCAAYLLVARATASRGAAKHTAAAVREVAAREARFKGKTATAREAATCAADAREATWSLM
jgi:hypothetical protein